VRIVVDQEACRSHGQCEIAAPGLFEIDDEGVARVLVAEPGESWRTAAEIAVQRCPERAITVED
jgi:ferredoxin